MNPRDRLLEDIRLFAVQRRVVTLSSGAMSDLYVDLRQITLRQHTSQLVGQLMTLLTAQWRPAAVGGLTMGADPVAFAMMQFSPVDAFVVRKAAKGHGLRNRIEGPSIRARRVVVVEDVCTTGQSAIEAVEAVRAEGGHVVGVAAVVHRGADLADLPYAYLYEEAELR